MNTPTSDRTVLGLDLGAGSVGWALLNFNGTEPKNIAAAGARVFDPGMDGNLESGREESRNVKRRTARLQRRQTWRRSQRARRVYSLLQKFGLLPSEGSPGAEARHKAIDALDAEILASPWFKEQSAADIVEPFQVMPYLLRAAALNGQLPPFHVGRALYHLAQRRGFKSNRKALPARKNKKDEEEAGKVKARISALREEMKTANARTLGEFFARINPHERRIRARYTHRSMYEHEFQEIWQSQAPAHPTLMTDERRKALHRAIFFQRPIRFPRNLVGQCDLEPGKRRAPRHLLLSQQFRLLQKVNDLEVTGRRLTPEERAQLLDRLESGADATFSEIRKLLGLPRGNKFNLEVAGEEKIPGNRTNAAFLGAFGERWNAMTAQQRDAAVEYVWSFAKQDKLAPAAARKWALDSEAAERVSQIALEPDYMSLSRCAMEKLVPLLQPGKRYAEAVKQVYPSRNLANEPLAFLPPVALWKKDLRNPTVARVLTEMRKVINALIRRDGKPSEIRIELARDLRNSKKQRQRIWETNRENERARKKALERALREVPGHQPSRTDLLKVQLADECGWLCPYTGKPISMRALIGPEPQFDIEHILPFAKSLDNSFANLTLCDAEHNRSVKGRRAPCEAYGANPETFSQILDRARKFKSQVAAEKLRRFTMTSEEVNGYLNQFEDRLLNDTRYATRLATEYLGLLYGGVIDSEGRRRVRVTSGRVTSFLRDEWKLNTVLGDGATSAGGRIEKFRGDHRHHSVDAVVTALTDDATIQLLSRAAEKAPVEHRRRFASLQGPWPDFADSVRDTIHDIVVSHRVNRKVSGALHEETLYSRPFARSTGHRAKNDFRVRKPLAELSPADINEIVEPNVRALIEAKLAQFPGVNPKDLFSVEANRPEFVAHDGRRVPIKRVRVRKRVNPRTLGSGARVRYAETGSNHHVEIFAVLDSNGREVGWDAEVVSILQAIERLTRSEPIVNRNHGDATEFRFSLAQGEVVAVPEGEMQKLLLVRASTQGANGAVQVALSPIADARQKPDQVADGSYIRKAPSTLRDWKARKVTITPLGEVREAHD